MGPWYVIVESIRQNHNGVFSVDLHMGHDGHNVCRFRNYEEGDRGIIAKGESGTDMQEAVERCYNDWSSGTRSLDEQSALFT